MVGGGVSISDTVWNTKTPQVFEMCGRKVGVVNGILLQQSVLRWRKSKMTLGKKFYMVRSNWHKFWARWYNLERNTKIVYGGCAKAMR